MGFTNASNSIFPPVTLQPLYRIWRDWCIGDSLGYMNDNFLYLDTKIDTLSSSLNTYEKINANFTAQDVSGQSSVQFLNIPSWAKRITMVCNKIHITDNGYMNVHIGTASGFEVTGYEVVTSINVDPSITSTGLSDGFLINQQDMLPNFTYLTGTVTLTNLVGTNTWVENHMLSTHMTGNVVIGGGTKTLPGVLDRVRLFAGFGIGTFTSGTLNIFCEG